MGTEPRPITPAGYMLVSNEDYRRLIDAARCDDTLIWCDLCGAWMDHEDPAVAATDDFTGCWKATTGDAKYDGECRYYRAPNDN